MGELRPLRLPDRGAGNNTRFVDTPGDLAPPPRVRNVRRTHAISDRPQISGRAGWVRANKTALGAGMIQGLLAVSRPEIREGYQPVNCRAGGPGQSKEAEAIAGNGFVLDVVPSMAASHTLDVSGLGGPATVTCNACALSPDGTRMALVANWTHTTTGELNSTIQAINIATGAILWTHTITESGKDRYTNGIEWGHSFVYIATNQYVRVLDQDDGTQVGVEDDVGGWAQEVIDIAAQSAVGGGGVTIDTFLFVAFDGSTKAAASPITIEGGNPARHFRSGVARYQVFVTIGIERTRWGDALDPADPFFEADHGYVRISEITSVRPHGAKINAMALGPGGAVYIARCNCGYGPVAASYPPDGLVLPLITVMKINADGSLGWEADTLSILETGLGGFLNDLPTAAGDEPSLLAICVGAAGVFVAGRENLAGDSAFCLDPDNGSTLWSIPLIGAGGTTKVIREGAAAIDPTDGNPIFAGDRVNDWPGASSANAHLWKLKAQNGEVVWAFDLGAAVSALGVDVSPTGEVAYATDEV